MPHYYPYYAILRLVTQRFTPRKASLYESQNVALFIAAPGTGSLFGSRLTDVTTDYYPANRLYLTHLERKGKEKEGLVDGDNLTRFEALNAGTALVVELERPSKMDRIVYVSRNGDNYVMPGGTYELFYQNGEKGWKSLGMRTATEERLVYEGVPRGVLLWLHNHTHGVEEQVFRWLDGKQVFCYKI